MNSFEALRHENGSGWTSRPTWTITTHQHQVAAIRCHLLPPSAKSMQCLVHQRELSEGMADLLNSIVIAITMIRRLDVWASNPACIRCCHHHKQVYRVI